MLVIVPCKNCLTRELGCHSTCERYHQYKNLKAQENQSRGQYLSMRNFDIDLTQKLGKKVFMDYGKRGRRRF